MPTWPASTLMAGASSIGLRTTRINAQARGGHYDQGKSRHHVERAQERLQVLLQHYTLPAILIGASKPRAIAVNTLAARLDMEDRYSEFRHAGLHRGDGGQKLCPAVATH